MTTKKIQNFQCAMMSKSSANPLPLKSGVKCMSRLKNAFNSEAPINTCLRQRQRSVMYPVAGLTTILKIGINVKIIPMTSIGIPRCLAIVGKNRFIGAIPEIKVYTSYFIKKQRLKNRKELSITKTRD